MTLDEATCWVRLRSSRHAVLATLHRERGLDAVPVVYAVEGDRLLLPIDTVKAKRGGELQRVRNLRSDARCVLLVEHYDDDWSRLWWVRVHGTASLLSEPTPAMSSILADRFEEYREAGSVSAVLILEPTAVAGWAAGRSR